MERMGGIYYTVIKYTVIHVFACIMHPPPLSNMERAICPVKEDFFSPLLLLGLVMISIKWLKTILIVTRCYKLVVQLHNDVCMAGHNFHLITHLDGDWCRWRCRLDPPPEIHHHLLGLRWWNNLSHSLGTFYRSGMSRYFHKGLCNSSFFFQPSNWPPALTPLNTW